MAKSLAGTMRHRVQILELVTSRDAYGGVIESWQPLADTPDGRLWAQVVPVSGREYTASAAVQDQTVMRATIRHRDDVAPTMRLVHDEQTYDITAVLPDPESGREYLTLMCATTTGA
jgi:SPP1 family predicted phage head-tail adaptor